MTFSCHLNSTFCPKIMKSRKSVVHRRQWRFQGAQGRRTPPGQNFFIFMQFLGKIGQIVGWNPLRGWRPSGKYWVRHLKGTTIRYLFSLPFVFERNVLFRLVLHLWITKTMSRSNKFNSYLLWNLVFRYCYLSLKSHQLWIPGYFRNALINNWNWVMI